MKVKKVLIILLLILLFIVTWAMVITAASGEQKKKEQNGMVSEADGYAGRALYVRAIPLYESALEISTDLNPEIEAKLLSSYFSHGDENKYISLVEKRMVDDTATDEEVLNAAGYLINHSSTAEAMKMLETGIEKSGSQILTDYYESNAYKYKMVGTDYQEVIPAENDKLLAAFDGSKWYYIDSEYAWVRMGSLSFNSATAFSPEGYAVVSDGQMLYTILEDGDHYGASSEKFEDIFGISGKRILAKKEGKYSYYSPDFEPIAESHQYDEITCNADGVAAVKKGEQWGIITDGGKVVVDFTLEDVAVNSLKKAFSNGCAMVKYGGRWHLINTEGEEIIEDSFADARAPESDGYIAVADDNGKWGFIDRNGNPVIDHLYDDAMSFSDGLAPVKAGNRWKYISVMNNRVIDEDLLEAGPFHNGKAIVKTMDGAVIIKLMYYRKSKY